MSSSKQVLEVFVTERPTPRIILVTVSEIRQYELNWWQKLHRSTKFANLATFVAKNFKTKHGALIAVYQPQGALVEICEPVLLLKLVSVKVDIQQDEVTCMELCHGGVVLGFRSGLSNLYDLETG